MDSGLMEYRLTTCAFVSELVVYYESMLNQILLRLLRQGLSRPLPRTPHGHHATRLLPPEGYPTRITLHHTTFIGAGQYARG